MSDPIQPPVDPTSSKPADSSMPPATPPTAAAPAPAYPSYPAPDAPAPGGSSQAPVYGQPPAYGQNPYGQQNPQDKYNVLSIISLVTSLLGISLVGIITGHIGMSQIKKTGEKGYGLALWGLIVGYVGFVMGIIAIVFAIALFISAATTGASYSN